MLQSVAQELEVAILLAGLSALMYGAGDFCGGMGARKSPILAVLAFSQLTGLVVAVATALVMRQQLPGPADQAWGAVAGVCGAAGLAALYTAIATTPVAVASPVAAVTGAIIPVLLGLSLGDRPGPLGWAGIVLAFPAIVLLTWAPAGRTGSTLVRRAALLGALAGLGFGLFFFAVSRTSRLSGLWPLVAARVTTMTVVALFALFTRRTLRPARGAFPVILLSGALDMGANIAFLLASRLGMLSVVAVVTSLYPGPTVLLAWAVFREHMSAARVAGLALAVTGVALISL
jgi:drug/metabolite transporter (DMT)-like permease